MASRRRRWSAASRPGSLSHIDLATLTREHDGKTESLYYAAVAKGGHLATALQGALDDVLAKLPIPKVMSYAAPGSYYNDVKFVRPAHRLVALHGANVVPVRALDLTAGRVTGGHRFLSGDDIAVATADAYAPTLEAEGKVIPSFAARRAAIVVGLEGAAGNATPIMPDALLDEVTALVEWPAVYAGTFDAAFLDVPQECLILTMQLNQRYFALADDTGKLINRFLLVSNIETTDPSAIVSGNERVLRARLADAKFFFDQDRRQSLESRLPKLACVVYHNKLGTQADRSARVGAVAAAIAGRIGCRPRAGAARSPAGEDRSRHRHGRRISGIAGPDGALLRRARRRDARRVRGDRTALLATLRRRRAAGGSGRAKPGAGRQVRHARRHLGHRPRSHRRQGSVRPAPARARRAAHPAGAPAAAGITGTAGSSLPSSFRPSTLAPDTATGVDGFMHDRLRQLLRDTGAAPNEVEAVLADNPARIDLVAPAWPPSRPSPRCRKPPRSRPPTSASSTSCARTATTRRLPSTAVGLPRAPSTISSSRSRNSTPQVEADYAQRRFQRRPAALATAKPVVDRYFDDVMVMVDDPALRANRLALLRSVAATMNRVADISRLAQ